MKIFINPTLPHSLSHHEKQCKAEKREEEEKKKKKKKIATMTMKALDKRQWVGSIESTA
jgi:hypothetical protein